jgi:hypothetical protein
MKLKTRNSDLSIERISNGYILTLCGRDNQGNYLTDKLFVKELADVNLVISDYFDLPEDN